MGVMFLKVFAGLVGGMYFGQLQKEGKVSFGKGLVLTILFSLILSFLIDFIILR